MSRDYTSSSYGVRLTGFAANHPRLIMTLVLLLAFVVAQGSVAAATDVDPGGTLFDTSGSGSVDDGP